MSSPDGQLHAQVAVDGNGQQGKDGGLGEDHHEAAEEEAEMERDADVQTDQHGQRDDNQPHCNVSQRQGGDEVHGGVVEGCVQLHRPDHRDVPQGSEQSHQALSANVDRIRAAHHLAGVEGSIGGAAAGWAVGWAHGCRRSLWHPQCCCGSSLCFPGV